MNAYLQVFVNFEKDNWVKFLLIAKFTYNNVKNANIDYISFELNYGFYFQTFYKKDVNLSFQLKSADKLVNKLKKLIDV